MVKVRKRNGNLVPFDVHKIENALQKAFLSCDYEVDESVIKDIASHVSVWDEISIEDIQDQIEELLMDWDFPAVAKSYILYREKHSESRFIKERLDYMDKYSYSNNNAATSSETDANANVTMKNVANLEGEVYKTTNRIIQRQRMKDKLNEMFPEVAKQYEKDLDSHIIYAHDESQTPVPKNYCMACTLYPLMLEGTGNIDGVTPSAPNDLQSFSGQVTNLMFLLSSQVRGAVAMGDYIVAFNYYVVKEFGEDWYNKLNDTISCTPSKEIRNVKSAICKAFKQFIYGINQPAGNRSYNSPFSNLNFFDKYYFESLFKDFYYPDGTKPEWKAIDTLQRIFVVLLRELRLKKPLTFPVTSFCCLHDNKDFLDKDYKDFIADEWSKGSSFFLYLSNNPDSISSCCRVQNELTDNTFNSTIGLTGIMTGSTNVITLNLNRIIQDWWKSTGTTDKFNLEEHGQSLRDYLTSILERVYKYQIAYKTIIYNLEDAKMYSSSNAGYIFTKKLYCTIGAIGYCEAAQFLGYDINYNEPYIKFLQLIFGTIQEENKKHSIHDKKRPFVFNLEAIPKLSGDVKSLLIDSKLLLYKFLNKRTTRRKQLYKCAA